MLAFYIIYIIEQLVFVNIYEDTSQFTDTVIMVEDVDFLCPTLGGFEFLILCFSPDIFRNPSLAIYFMCILGLWLHEN